MLLSLGLILLYELAGEAIARGTNVPVPGPVIGPVIGLVLCVLLLAAGDRAGRLAPAELGTALSRKPGATFCRTCPCCSFRPA